MATDNITVEQGATYTNVYEWQDEDGIPVGILALGYTQATMVFRDDWDWRGGVVWYQATETSGIELEPGGATGQIHITIPSTATDAFPISGGFFELRLITTDTPPVVERLVEGRVFVSPQIVTTA